MMTKKMSKPAYFFFMMIFMMVISHVSYAFTVQTSQNQHQLVKLQQHTSSQNIVCDQHHHKVSEIEQDECPQITVEATHHEHICQNCDQWHCQMNTTYLIDSSYQIIPITARYLPQKLYFYYFNQYIEHLAPPLLRPPKT